MIRINLLGQTRPKTGRRQVDTGSAMPAIFLLSGVVLGLAFLTFLYLTWQKQLNEENSRIAQLSAEKTQLEQIKQQVDSFQKQKQVLQQRVSTIEAAAARSHRRAGIAGHGGEHRFADRKPVADDSNAEGQQPDVAGFVGFDQFGGKFYYRVETIGIFPKGGNQGIEAGREKHRGTDLYV